jgi:hypothetical protein
MHGVLASHTELASQFFRLHGYERGVEHSNPAYDRRFRVNPRRWCFTRNLASESRRARTE